MLNTVYLKNETPPNFLIPLTLFLEFCPSSLLPLQRGVPQTAGNSVRAQGPARPRLAVIRVRHDDTAVQTDTAEDVGLIAWHHLH